MSASVIAGTQEPPAFPADEKLSEQEVEQGRKFLRDTQNSVMGATKGLSEAQWKFKPAPDRWSMAEILDHVVVVQERVLGPVLDMLAAAPPPPAGQDREAVDAIVIHQLPTRLARFSAPEAVHPAGGGAPEELLNRLRANYTRMTECLESRTGLRQHACPSPPIKAITKGAIEVMDGYQWILAAAAHTERHVKQMLEVKADSGFPEKGVS
jgi:DinB family protein